MPGDQTNSESGSFSSAIRVNAIPIDRPVAISEEGKIKTKLQITELDPKSRIGYHLARLVLGMISAFLIFLMIYILLNLSAHSSSKIDDQTLSKMSDSVLSKRTNLLKTIQAQEKDSRDFVFQISQMVLLNMLLPILTAILGYIFGSHSEAKG